jgi:hypothetical protein
MAKRLGSVLRIEITERLSPVFGGTIFGGVGAYECLTGTVFGAVDPRHPRNAGIVNLDKAPRDADGLVAYESAFSLLKPIDAAKGNGWLMYDVPNRGNKVALTRLNLGAEGNRPVTADHAGNGFLMRNGFSVIWSAWQTGVPSGADRLDARFPVAVDPNGPITGINRDEFIAEETGGPGDAFIQVITDDRFIATLSYPSADLDPAKAGLTVRQREKGPRANPAGLAWRYVDDRHIEVTRPSVPGFDRGSIFEFVYPARDPAVMGIGFAAIRDLVDFLRHGQPDDAGGPNPLGGSIRHTVGFGISQSGRILRDFVHLGFNQAASGGTVFDAILPVVGGSRRTYVNYAFAQPGRYARQHEDHSFLDDQFPFTYPTLHDPISGKTDGILRRAQAAGVAPKVFHLDTDSDLWVGRASLVATDSQGADVAMPDNVRIFMASGIQHAVLKPTAKQVTELPGNPLGYSSYMRALLIALTEWVEHGTVPPANRFPSRTEGTLVTREEAEAQFPRIPEVGFPDVLNELRLRDHSAEPPIEGAPYTVLVAAVDRDGNSLGGLRHPLLTAPLATYTGWAVRIPGYAAGDLYTIQGSIAPFPATSADRERIGDPRLSIEERYGSHTAWAARVIAATEELVRERLVLREDADRLIAAVGESRDVAAVL